MWRNAGGGEEVGWVGTGLAHVGLDVDFGKLAGWEGYAFGMNWLGLLGDDLSAEKTGNFLTVSNIAGYNTIRLYDCWVEGRWLGDQLSVRVGQLAADGDFLISEHASLFINGTFGWPALTYMNLPEGGPGFPMGAPGLRVAYAPAESLGFQAAIYQGNVFAQEDNPHGYRWNPGADTGWTIMAETALGWKLGAGGLPGQVKVGGWVQTGDDADTLSGTGRTNGGGWLVIDQCLYDEPCVRPHGPGAEEHPRQGLAAFFRTGGAPASRNFIDFYANAGLVYQGLLPGRDWDRVGLAFGYARIGDAGRDATAGEGMAPAAMEAVLELSYQIHVTPSFHIQPDLQYIIHPGGRTDLDDAFVFGWCGLNGKCFVPLLSGYACAIPGVMAARSLEDPKARITTILMTPLMSCSARLSVYVLLIGAFVEPVYGPVAAGWALFGMHLVGALVAMPFAWVMNRLVLKTKAQPFILEMPEYRIPLWRNLFTRMWERGWEFVVRAGSVILAFSIVIWALLYFPRSAETEDRTRSALAAKLEASLSPADIAAALDDPDSELSAELANRLTGAHIAESYLGRFGRAVQPLFDPAGFDWKITVGVISSFPAREVVIATLGILYNLGAEVDEESADLRSVLAAERWQDGHRAGQPVFTLPAVVAIMVFFALCAQCGATVAVVAKELNWRWAAGSFFGTTLAAWLGAVLVYQLGTLLGVAG